MSLDDFRKSNIRVISVPLLTLLKRLNWTKIGRDLFSKFLSDGIPSEKVVGQNVFKSLHRASI